MSGVGGKGRSARRTLEVREQTGKPEEFCSHWVLLEPSRIQQSVRPYTLGQFNKPKGNFHSSLIEAIALAARPLDFIMKRMQGRQQ
jgi:hypothetical protein